MLRFILVCFLDVRDIAFLTDKMWPFDRVDLGCPSLKKLSVALVGAIDLASVLHEIHMMDKLMQQDSTTGFFVIQNIFLHENRSRLRLV